MHQLFGQLHIFCIFLKMKLLILSIGKTNEKYLTDGIGIYLDRLKHYCRIIYEELKDVKPGLTGAETSLREAEMVLSKLKDDDVLILLDENGKLLSSEKFAEYLDNYRNRSVRNVIFLIGGAFGHHPKLKERAADLISLSPMTFTHQMCRLILAEQIYRAFTIIKNEKYHNR